MTPRAHKIARPTAQQTLEFGGGARPVQKVSGMQRYFADEAVDRCSCGKPAHVVEILPNGLGVAALAWLWCDGCWRRKMQRQGVEFEITTVQWFYDSAIKIMSGHRTTATPF